nr:hypothetical protein [Nocardioides panaciterrulae]
MVDPVAELRAAVRRAVAWAVAGAGSVLLLTDDVGEADRARGVVDPAGLRVGRSLLAAYGFTGEVRECALPAELSTARSAELPGELPETDAVLALASGSARRREGSPGYVDDRATGFDARLGAALSAPDPAALADLDQRLAAELWVTGARTFRALGGLLAGAGPAEVDLADDPFGVQYWVMRWTCGS